jgi:uncharacterized protein YfaS (alpha-2-macroglobulin family)
VHRALALYLLSLHFPERAKALSAKELAPMLGDIVAGRYQTLSSALSVLALDAHASLAPPAASAGLSLEALLEANASRPLATQGAGILVRADVPADAKRVRARGPSGQPLYAQLSEKGYDRTPPTDVLAQGIEVLRELRDASGKVVTSVALGERIDVVLQLRTTDQREQQVALIDLLPGGFEVDLAGQPLAERQTAEPSEYDWTPDYVDVREDRLVLYGWIGGDVRRFVYRLKPMNRGRYTVPPLQAEALYDRSVEGRAPGGSVEVRE